MLFEQAFFHYHERQFLVMERDVKTLDEIYSIIESCTGVGTLLDELTLLRVALKAYCNGAEPEDAVAWAAKHLSDIISKKDGDSGPH